MLLNTNGYDYSINVSYINKNNNIELQHDANNASVNAINADSYTIKIGSSEHRQKFSLGGVYTVLAIAKSPSIFVSCAQFLPEN